MQVSRRWWLKSGLAACAVLAMPTAFVGSAHAQSLVMHWPSTVIRLPAQHERELPPVVTAVGIHPNGKLLAAAGDDHSVYVWNLVDGQLVHRLREHTDWVHTLAFSPGGQALASAGADRRVIFWDAATAEKLYMFVSQTHPITALAWNRDGSLIAGTGFDDKLHVYDVAQRRLVHGLTCPSHDMRALDFSRDDQWLAAGGRDGIVRVWNVASGEKLADYTAHRHRIRGLAFSPDGQFIVSSGEDRQIHIHSLHSMTEGHDLARSPAKILSLAFYGPHHLATGCSDNVVRLWDIATQREIGQLKGHTGSVAALACHGSLLVSGSFDATVRVWTITENVASDPTPHQKTNPKTTLPVRTSRKPE